MAGGLALVIGLYLRSVTGTRELLMVLGPVRRQSSLTLVNHLNICQQAFFEIGALFFISKMFFLGEDDEKTIKDLMKELEEARASPG